MKIRADFINKNYILGNRLTDFWETHNLLVRSSELC